LHARVQRNRESRRRPLHPRPSNQEALISVAAAMESFLRREGNGFIPRNFALLLRRKPPDRCHEIYGKTAEGEGRTKERATRRRG
jgi:hypothetical protein